MMVFLDFEASSLSDDSYPIEVGWMFEDGRSESHLIAPAPDWGDWNDAAEAVHGISRATLAANGTAHGRVAARMVEVLAGHELFASAPSWDGKWLSRLLRGAGLPRHTLRLRETDDALRETATSILRTVVAEPRLASEVEDLIARASAVPSGEPVHRALADAQAEHARWQRLRDAAVARRRDLA